MSNVGTVITGLNFKKTYSGTVFYKLTNRDEYHNGLQFKTGLNADIITFNPKGRCEKGGLYFTEYKKIAMWIRYTITDMYWMRKVNILDDSLIYIEENKFKANKFVLEERVCIWSNMDVCIFAVLYDGIFLKEIEKDKQTESLCKLAVMSYGPALEYVKECFKTKDICKLAVKSSGLALEFVPHGHQTEKLCLAAVGSNGIALKFVNEKLQTREMCDIAVNQNKSAVWYVSKKYLSSFNC